ncbi:MAG: hypothetical protein MK085_01860 [Phycisphaerales bacterium]|nr:hypothetical protein [Phycisphaerales bacterium]
MQRPRVSTILVVILGGLVLGVITMTGATWYLLGLAERVPVNATVRSIDKQVWRYVHNQAIGVDWIALADWGHDMVNDGPGLEPVPEWARPRMARPEAGRLRVGTIQAGWPRPWIGAWWASNRRDEGWPPVPFDEDLGYGIEDAARRFLNLQDEPTYYLLTDGLVIDLLVASSPWWLMLSMVAWYRGRTGMAHSQADQPGSKGTTN